MDKILRRDLSLNPYFAARANCRATAKSKTLMIILKIYKRQSTAGKAVLAVSCAQTASTSNTIDKKRIVNNCVLRYFKQFNY